MTFLDCNELAITGYSACWRTRVLTLHAHRDGEGTEFYDVQDMLHENAIWLYMPVDRGEFISEIWSQSTKYCRGLDLMARAISLL